MTRTSREAMVMAVASLNIIVPFHRGLLASWSSFAKLSTPVYIQLRLNYYLHGSSVSAVLVFNFSPDSEVEGGAAWQGDLGISLSHFHNG
jgi:hypothetical protein